MKSSARRFGLAVLLFSLAGCGLKGPLYLPDAKQPAVPETTPKVVFEGSKVLAVPPAPQAQKKDRTGASSPTPDPSTPGQSQPTPVSPPGPATAPSPKAGQ